ncbi:MAG: hypothetical protein LKJ90_08100 [Faecalibacterium sp.]|jgi:uncharacterized lipoprotein NlpE involved in copper resistance|nr:hypothetical protein [Faecalibacterium sp.]
MKKKITIRAAAVAAAAALTLTLAGCNNSASSGAASSAAPSPSSSASAGETGVKTGFGVTAALTEGNLSGKASVTAAGVLLDEDGKIVQCVIDVAENEFGVNADGTLAMPAVAATKWEQGESYGLKSASGIGKEWYEQSKAFCEYVKGKTSAEVADIAVEDNKATDPDLLSGCTIKITPFISAVTKACDNAKVRGAGKADSLSMGAVSTASGSDATDDADGKAQVATTFVVLTKDGDGRVTSAIMDQIEAYFTTDTSGALTAPKDAVISKLEKGADYGMKGVSGIGKEWYEQSEGFCEYLKGKTAGEIRAIPANGTDADLAAVCTINWTDMLQAATKAADAA